MGVFDPRQGQVLPSPVTNFYKGKAIRQELADAEQMAELRGLQIELAKQEIENAPAKAAQAQEMYELDRQKAIIDVQKGIEELGFNRMKRRADALRPVIADAEKLFKAGKIEEAQKLMSEGVPASLMDVEPEASEQYAEMAGPDKIWQPEEMMRLKNRVEAFGAIEEEAGALTSHQKHLGELRDAGYISDEEYNKIMLDIEKKAATITGTTEYDPGAKDPRTPSQIGSDFSIAKEEYDDSSDLREMIFDFMPKAIELPNAVGGMAKLAQNVASLATALGQDATADMIMQNLTETDQETLSAMQTQLSLIRSRVRPIATGDSGTRQSESERQLANQVVQLTENLDSPAEVLKNYPRAMGALKQLSVETLVRQYQNAKRWDEIDAPYDLASDEGKRGLLTDLSNAGFDEDSALDALRRLETIQSGK